jgi:arabinogalactan endo-1,4-beta-galactosidase
MTQSILAGQLTNFEAYYFLMKRNLQGIFFIVCLLLVWGCQKTPGRLPSGGDTTKTNPPAFLTYRAMDLSYDYKIEDERGIHFTDSAGVHKPLMQICSESGVNMVRLRLWVNPSDSDKECSLAVVLSQAMKIKGYGMKLWLDMHFSDTWADPGHQLVPAAWQAIPYGDLLDSVNKYTLSVLTQLQSQGTPPQIVQIGNEINAGMLWPYGNISDNADSSWNKLSAILDTAYAAVRQVSPATEVMIHFAGITGADYFFTQCDRYHVHYDLMGISFYPWWHGKDFGVLGMGLNTLVTNHGKGVLIAETAYPFTLNAADQASNTVGDISQLMSQYPPSPQGQLDYLSGLSKVVLSVPGGKGLGISYWEPDWVAYAGPQATDWQNGSDWENLALFDFTYKALPGLRAFVGK